MTARSLFETENNAMLAMFLKGLCVLVIVILYAIAVFGSMYPKTPTWKGFLTRFFIPPLFVGGVVGLCIALGYLVEHL